MVDGEIDREPAHEDESQERGRGKQEHGRQERDHTPSERAERGGYDGDDEKDCGERDQVEFL